MARTITAANCIYMLAILPIFPAPQRLQGFMADAAFDTEAVEIAENVLGVDGKMSSGWLPRLTKQTISIMPDSATSDMFEQWVQAQDAAQEIFPATGTLIIPGTGRKYAMTNGVLTSFTSIPGVKKVLEGRPFVITWEAVTPAII